jgi:hypothetical protein
MTNGNGGREKSIERKVNFILEFVLPNILSASSSIACCHHIYVLSS